MGIFNEFFKKEKPVFTGLKFGFGSGGGGGGGQQNHKMLLVHSGTVLQNGISLLPVMVIDIKFLPHQLI